MKLRHAFAVATAIVAITSPATARRTAIDNPGFVYQGYCDFNGDECGQSPADGLTLPYSFSFDGSHYSNKIFINGNGVFSFGAAINFANFQQYADGNSYSKFLLPIDPKLFGLNLIDGGLIDPEVDRTASGYVFISGGTLAQDSGGLITAKWYDCPGVACLFGTQQSVTLMRTAGGFVGSILHDYDDRLPDSTTVGTVINGQYAELDENAFFIPATFADLPSAVPEPASWAMMIGGVGFAGGAMRRKRSVKVTYA